MKTIASSWKMVCCDGKTTGKLPILIVIISWSQNKSLMKCSIVYIEKLRIVLFFLFVLSYSMKMKTNCSLIATPDEKAIVFFGFACLFSVCWAWNLRKFRFQCWLILFWLQFGNELHHKHTQLFYKLGESPFVSNERVNE